MPRKEAIIWVSSWSIAPAGPRSVRRPASRPAAGILTGSLAAGGSYLSASQPRAWFGLGRATTVSRVEVDWPWGSSEVWINPTLSPRGGLKLRQGTGRTIR